MIVETEQGPVSLERRGAGPDLIMLHSLLSDRHIYDRIVPALSASWRINLVDLPGFGATVQTIADIDAFADSIGALLDAEDYDRHTTAVMGNGLGAFVALGVAIRHGDRFDKLVLVGCGSSFDDSVRPQFLAMADKAQQGGMDAVSDLAIGRIFTAEFAAANPDMVAERRDVLAKTDPGAFETACRALYKLDYDELVGGVTNPTLVVVGSEDTPTPPAMGKHLHELLPNSEYVELEGLAHAPQLQDPEGFLSAITPFLTV